MKKILKSITILAFIINSAIINAQITANIDQVFANSQTTVTGCNTIDFGTNSNNHLVFYFTLTKNANYTVEDGYLKIILKYSSNSSSFRESLYIPASLWNDTQYVHTIATNISANEVQVNGSSIYLEFTQVSNPSTYYNSCEHPIIKTQLPTFTLSPSTVSIPCGSVAPVTFTFSNVYNTPNVAYNYGYSGWTFVSQTTNSITLKPTNSNIIPSNFSLIPLVNGIAQPNKTCVVSRAPFTTNSDIQGNSTVCPGSTQTFNLTNSSTFTNVSWNIPQTSVAIISSSTNSSVTVQILTSGTFTINAAVTNSCSQPATISKTYNAGYPAVNPAINKIEGVNSWYANNNNYDTVNAYITNVNGATSYEWILTGGPTNCFNKPKFSNGSTSSMITSSPNVTFEYNSCIGQYYLRCKPINACGSTNGLQISFLVGDPSDNPCNQDQGPVGKFSTKIINPIKDDVIVSNIHISMLPCDFVEQSGLKFSNNEEKELKLLNEYRNADYKVEIYDFYGKKIFSNTFNTQNISIKGLGLMKGIYIMNTQYPNGKYSTEKLIVE